jgi:hypothetical protein
VADGCSVILSVFIMQWEMKRLKGLDAGEEKTYK